MKPISNLYKHELGTYHDYDLCLDTGTLGYDNCIEIITSLRKTAGVESEASVEGPLQAVNSNKAVAVRKSVPQPLYFSTF
mgnify:CR=1 FL=1